jgi:hypothetical protein
MLHFCFKFQPINVYPLCDESTNIKEDSFMYILRRGGCIYI